MLGEEEVGAELEVDLMEEGVGGAAVGAPEGWREAKKKGGGGVSEGAGTGGEVEGGVGGPGIRERRVCLGWVARELCVAGVSGEGVRRVVVPSLGYEGNYLVIEEGVGGGGGGGGIECRIIRVGGGVGGVRRGRWSVVRRRGCGERGKEKGVAGNRGRCGARVRLFEGAGEGMGGEGGGEGEGGLGGAGVDVEAGGCVDDRWEERWGEGRSGGLGLERCGGEEDDLGLEEEGVGVSKVGRMGGERGRSRKGRRVLGGARAAGRSSG